MNYYEAIANAILRIEGEVRKPVRLVCDIKARWVEVHVKVGGKWVVSDKIYGFDDVSHLEVEQFILGAIENAQ
jgi:hypothetical protein